jgi:antitoxin ParD1/3/4
MAAKRGKGPKTEKTAISLPEDLLEHAHRMVRQGRAPSISGYFAALAQRDRARQAFGKFVAELEQDLGMTDDDRGRLDAELGIASRRKQARKAS